MLQDFLLGSRVPRVGKGDISPHALGTAMEMCFKRARSRLATWLWRRRWPLVLRNPDSHILGRHLSEERYCAAFAKLVGVYWHAQDLRDVKAQNQGPLSRLRQGQTMMAILQSRLTQAECVEKTVRSQDLQTCHHGMDGILSCHNPDGATLQETHWMRIAASPCLICGTAPTQPHPIPSQTKTENVLAVPLCVSHANQLAAFGSEEAWWRVVGIDPVVIAQAMWRETLTPLARLQPCGPNRHASVSGKT